METLNMIQQFAPATIIALAALPWVAATMMHAFGTLADTVHDDKWNTRAGAAVRWAGALAAQPRFYGDAVVQLATRRASRNHAARAVESFPYAA